MLAILIPYTHDREVLFQRVRKQLLDQIQFRPVMLLSDVDQGHKNGGLTTGAKRNRLLDVAKEEGATYVAFVDSDDLVAPNYIDRGIEVMNSGLDCGELWGQYYENGKQSNPFHHSLVHDHWWQDDKFFYRNPNHLNFIKLACLEGIRYKDQTIGEDGHFSLDIQKAGVLKTEYPIKQVLYYYFAGGRKDHKMEEQIAKQRGINIYIKKR